MKQTEVKTPVSFARINRTRARAWAIQMHYQWDVSKSGDSLSQTLEDILANRRVSATRIPYVKRIASNLDRYGTQVDDALNAVLENWRLDRLAAIDRAVLRIAALEILFFSDVPHKVSILEGVRLAESYGGTESPGFVNGVLDALMAQKG